MGCFFIFVLFICQSSFGQIKIGLYSQKSDTTGKRWGLSASQISFKKDSTFTYNYRYSAGCLIWYDIKGTWITNNNELYLVDTAIVTNTKNETETLLRKSLFKIENDNLKFIYAYFDKRRQDCKALRDIAGNFIYSSPLK